MKEENNSKAARIKKGDTLDYYNDSIPKKAVESLFDKDDKKRPEDPFVKGYDPDSNQDSDYDPDNPGNPDYDYDNDYPDKDAAIQEKPAFKPKSAPYPDPDEDPDDPLTIYSKSQKQHRNDYDDDEPRYTRLEALRRHTGDTGDPYDDTRRSRPNTGEIPRRPQTDQPRRSDPDSLTKRNTADYPRRPLSPDDQPRRDHTRRAPTDDIPKGINSTDISRRPSADDRPTRPRPGIGADPQRRQKPDDRAPANPARRPRHQNPQTKEATSRLFDNDESENESPIPLRTIITAASAVAILILIVVLMVRINSLNSELVKTHGDQDKYEKATKDLELAKIENDNLKTQIDQITADLQLYKAFYDANAPSDDDPNGAAGTPAPNPTTPPDPIATPDPPPPQPTTYTVVSGDTLGKISTKFYGDDRDGVRRIKEANNLTSDVIRVGQSLNIP